MAGKMRFGIMLLLLFCMIIPCCIPALAAQDTDFRLEMDSLNLQKGVSSTIVVSLINAKDAQIVSIDGLENFDVLSQSQSSSTSIVNNVAAYRMDIYYTVMPKTAGQFTLKGNIKFDGKSYETNSLEVTITEGSDNGNVSNPDLFVKTVLSHEEAYLGEKVVITYEVYSREHVDSLGFTDYLTIDGAVSKELPDSQIMYETVYIDGNKYVKYIVKQLIIDPIKAGVCTIPSFNLQVNVISEDSFGGFGGFGGMMQTTVPRYLQTEEVELLIKPLPAAHKPDDFSGIVGELNLTGHYSRNELNYGDSLTLQVEMSGNCNLDGLKNIFGGTVSGFTVYENQKNAAEAIENNQYYAQKTFEVILIPESNGTIDTPPVSLSYFNPVTEQYETAKLAGETIHVLGDMPPSSEGGGNQSPVISYETVLINQVNYEGAFNGYYIMRIQKETVTAILMGIAIMAVLGAAVICLVLYKRKQNTEIKTVYKRLMKAQDVNEIYNFFNVMMKHCFGLNLKASSQSSIMSGLPDSDLASQVGDIMSYMESREAYGETGAQALKKKIKSLYRQKKMGSKF